MISLNDMNNVSLMCLKRSDFLILFVLQKP
nr:MAG TPA: hypothetical protein [Caudoviricetes sp.]